MIYSKPITDIITKRYSCRSYKPSSLPPELKDKIVNYLNREHRGPFGNRIWFALVENAALAGRQKIGTYGFISGAESYIAGAVASAAMNFEDFGYTMEALILYLTDCGLGTCWLGGSLKRREFVEPLNATPDELIPAVTPVGLKPEQESIRSRSIRWMVSAKQRNPWSALFFDGDLSTPLDKKDVGNYVTALEMLRLAPSASNRQPWRIIYDRNQRAFNFLVARNKSFSLFPGNNKIDLQRVDMGIACCHFELTAREIGLSGYWERKALVSPTPPNMEYIASWIDESEVLNHDIPKKHYRYEK